MNSEILVAIISGLTGITTGLIPHFLDKRKDRKTREEDAENKDLLCKLVYVKVVHLTSKKAGYAPVKKVYLDRLEKTIDVFDEHDYFRLNVFQTPQKELTTQNRSSGVVDFQILHPWKDSLHFTDEGARKIEQYINQCLPGPSNTFFSKSIFYNGLQPGNEDVAMKMEQNADEARLIVDFSSITNLDNILKTHPKAILRLATESGPKDKEISVQRISPGIYMVREPKLKKEDVICMKFNFDWDFIDQLTPKA